MTTQKMFIFCYGKICKKVYTEGFILASFVVSVPLFTYFESICHRDFVILQVFDFSV